MLQRFIRPLVYSIFIGIALYIAMIVISGYDDIKAAFYQGKPFRTTANIWPISVKLFTPVRSLALVSQSTWTQSASRQRLFILPRRIFVNHNARKSWRSDSIDLFKATQHKSHRQPCHSVRRTIFGFIVDRTSSCICSHSFQRLSKH